MSDRPISEVKAELLDQMLIRLKAETEINFLLVELFGKLEQFIPDIQLKTLAPARKEALDAQAN